MENNIEQPQMNNIKKNDFMFKVQIVIITVLALIVAYNLGRLYNVGSGVTGAVVGVSEIPASEIIPTGVPPVYGKELGIKYDDVSPNNPKLADATINKLSEYEDKELKSELMNRYIKIGSSISCEYCCGVDAIIFSNGQAACGCAHSFAMRGLAKYLLIKHPDMANDEILNELGKWKVLFFPGIHEKKASVLKSKGIELSYINLASNKYRGIEQGQTNGDDMSSHHSEDAGSSMVGGC